MLQIGQRLKKGEDLFCCFVDNIEKEKIADISVRKALKKYDVKNLKINNVTPLRAKKMYSMILPKYLSKSIRYQNGVTTDKSWLQNERRLFVWCTLCFLYKKSIQISQLVHQHQCQKTVDFEYLREMFPLKQLDLIKFQIYSLVKKDNKNCKWKDDEDNLLKQLVEYVFWLFFMKQKGKNIQWSNISKQFFSLSSQSYFRNAKQCRQRWLNHLDPKKTKGKWETKQDKILLNEVLQKGKKWSKIVEALDGKKNEHMIKNRFKSLIHKKEKQTKSRKLKQNDIIRLILKDIDEQKEEVQSSESQELSEQMQEKQSDEQQSQNNRSMSLLQRNSRNTSNFITQQKSSKWPIIVQPNNKKDVLKDDFIMEDNRDNLFMRSEVEVEMCGSKVDKQFVNSLFFSVNTPVADQRLQSINLETRSPASIFMSPFPGGCWTPTIFILDDTQGQISPSMQQLQDFSATQRIMQNQFLPEQNLKRI